MWDIQVLLAIEVEPTAVGRVVNSVWVSRGNRPNDFLEGNCRGLGIGERIIGDLWHPALFEGPPQANEKHQEPLGKAPAHHHHGPSL